jgi:serine/threonine protein kinase
MSLPEPKDDWPKGSSILGRWTTLKEPIKGGMGIVLRVRDEKFNTEAAIKISNTDVKREIFEREARVMLGIDPHPNVAMLFQVDRLRGRPLIVMNYYSEGSLRPWINSAWLLVQTELVLRLALQVCDGMLHVQQCGVAIHADLKPDNLLLISREAIAVSDFGLALARGEAKEGIGTYEYMAPEVGAGGAVSERADLYSFGATLYEMLTGSPPFGMRSEKERTLEEIKELQRRHREQQPFQDSRIPIGVWRIVQDCLAKIPDDRPASFSVVREQLGQAYAELVCMDPPAPLRSFDVSAWDWTMRGLGLCNLNRHEEETICHQRAIELDPELAAARSNLASNLRELGRLDEALAEADRSISLDSALLQALDIRGSILDELGDVEGAEVQFRRTIKIDPAYMWAWYNLGVLLQNQGRSSEAMKCYEESVRLQPHHAQSWTNMGCIWVDQKDWQQAENCYRTALKHEPCLNEAISNLGALLRKQGRHEEAIRLFDEVLKECG